MPYRRDSIGTRGEGITTTLLTRLHGRLEPLFRPQFLGDKYPSIDFFVQLEGANAHGSMAALTPFFLAQVKTTTLGYTVRDQKLKIQVTTKGMSELLAYPAPTYIIGIDDPAEVGYIVAAVTGGPARLPSLPIRYPLNKDTLDALYKEVLQYWKANAGAFTHSGLI